MNDCTCSDCQGACTSKPGWFMPGEVERLADHLGTTVEDVFANRLAVDWFEGEGGDMPTVFVLAPALNAGPVGAEYPGKPTGRCSQFVDGLCAIHAAKPHECAAYIHDEPYAGVIARHRAVAEAWNTPEHQAQIEHLLGRPATAADYVAPGWWLG
jgi:hypothetical protein